LKKKAAVQATGRAPPRFSLYECDGIDLVLVELMPGGNSSWARVTPQVVAVQLDQVEGIEEDWGR